VTLRRNSSNKPGCLVFTKVAKVQTFSLSASYIVAFELTKPKKPFSDGSLVKKCAIEMGKAFGDSGMAEKFETVSLSHQTVREEKLIWMKMSEVDFAM
jgi:hypothetical protein